MALTGSQRAASQLQPPPLPWPPPRSAPLLQAEIRAQSDTSDHCPTPTFPFHPFYQGRARSDTVSCFNPLLPCLDSRTHLPQPSSPALYSLVSWSLMFVNLETPARDQLNHQPSLRFTGYSCPTEAGRENPKASQIGASSNPSPLMCLRAAWPSRCFVRSALSSSPATVTTSPRFSTSSYRILHMSIET